MAGTAELEARLLIVEGKLSNAVELPTVAVHIDDQVITDKTGYKVFGIRSGINSGRYSEFISAVANPTVDANVERFIYKSIS